MLRASTFRQFEKDHCVHVGSFGTGNSSHSFDSCFGISSTPFISSNSVRRFVHRTCSCNQFGIRDEREGYHGTFFIYLFLFIIFYFCDETFQEQAPRNLKKDRLVSAPLLSYAYLFSGLMMEAAACFVASCIVFWVNGISIPSIAFNNGNYFVAANPMVIVPRWAYFCPGGGTCFSPAQQVTILQQAAGAWYILLISSQVLHIWMVKTRRTSLFKHEIFGNMVIFFPVPLISIFHIRFQVMVYGVIIEAALMLIFVAIPGLNTSVMGAQLPPGLAILPLL